jgi:hypothetical protein
MNTYDFYEQVEESFTFPGVPTTPTATVYHEWGDVIVAEAPAILDTGNTYKVTIPDELIDSSGIWRIKWKATINSKDFYAYTNFNVYRTYVTWQDFVADYDDYDDLSFFVDFTKAERIARGIIDTYTGQNFQFYKNKTIILEGSGKDVLRFTERLNWYTAVTNDGTDYSSSVELDHSSKYFLRTVRPDTIDDPLDVIGTFSKNSTYSVTGDWGWVDVPSQIVDAAKLLIADLIDEVKREPHRYNVVFSGQDTNRLQFRNNVGGSCGNQDADILMMDYVYWTMEYV